MQCRVGCGACCIALSISSPIPGMPAGKAAGLRCLHLSADNRCELFGRPERPAVCRHLKPSLEMCGTSFVEAMAYLTMLEKRTAPSSTAQEGRRNRDATATTGGIAARGSPGMRAQPGGGP
jgi:hypothetical protein